jgi:hypothetical protein
MAEGKEARVAEEEVEARGEEGEDQHLCREEEIKAREQIGEREEPEAYDHPDQEPDAGSLH